VYKFPPPSPHPSPTPSTTSSSPHSPITKPKVPTKMQFPTLTLLPLFVLLTLTAAHPSPNAANTSPVARDLVEYPADHTVDMIKTAHAASGCNPGCPCVWCGMTMCCQCNC
jgi:hypothetical protein